MCQFKNDMNASYGSLRMLLNLALIYHNILWLGRAVSLLLPPVVWTPGMIGHFDNSVNEIFTNWILWMREFGQLKFCYHNLCGRLQQITTNLSKAVLVSVCWTCFI